MSRICLASLISNTAFDDVKHDDSSAGVFLKNESQRPCR